MSQKYSVSENTRVEIRDCENRVTVVGWDEAQTVAVDGTARQEGDLLLIGNEERVNVRVPRALAVTIMHCHADVSVRDLTGRVKLTEIQGDVSLNNLAGETLVREMEGDLAVRGVALVRGEGTWDGDLSARGVKQIDANNIGGDVSIRAIDALKIAHVDGDLIAAGLRGVVDAPDVEGDAVLSFDAAVETYLRADGDIVLNLPSDANAELELDAPRGDLTTRAPIKVVERDENHMHGTLGSGGPKIQAESTRGDLILRAGGAGSEYADYAEYANYAKYGGYGDLGRQIAEQVRESVHKSLADSGISRHRKHHRVEFRFGGRRHGESQPREEQVEQKPRGPAAGTPERQAILDAIARGEMSVDEAIQKLTGE